MLSVELSIADDPSPGNWIAPRLHGKFGAVTLTVPSGFAAYARICHPASDRDGKPVKWFEVAMATGHKAHPLMQWHALVGSSDCDKFKGSQWSGGPPERGNLAPRLLEELCRHLDDHTTDVAHCFFGLWTGWSWVRQGGILTNMWHSAEGVSSRGSAEMTSPTFSAEEIRRSCLELPDRDYLLLAGPLSGATKICYAVAPTRFASQSPNLFWPTDRAWFVASEIDFDSTLVGGSADLIQSILAAPGLDAWPVGPDDSLAANADDINCAAQETA